MVAALVWFVAVVAWWWKATAPLVEWERVSTPAVPAGALRLTLRREDGELVHLVVQPGSAVAVPEGTELVGASVVLDYGAG